jgi:hypothetical protein
MRIHHGHKWDAKPRLKPTASRKTFPPLERSAGHVQDALDLGHRGPRPARLHYLLGGSRAVRSGCGLDPAGTLNFFAPASDRRIDRPDVSSDALDRRDFRSTIGAILGGLTQNISELAPTVLTAAILNCDLVIFENFAMPPLYPGARGCVGERAFFWCRETPFGPFSRSATVGRTRVNTQRKSTSRRVSSATVCSSVSGYRSIEVDRRADFRELEKQRIRIIGDLCVRSAHTLCTLDTHPVYPADIVGDHRTRT